MMCGLDAHLLICYGIVLCYREVKKSQSIITDKDILIQQLKEELKQLRERKEGCGKCRT